MSRADFENNKGSGDVKDNAAWYEDGENEDSDANE